MLPLITTHAERCIGESNSCVLSHSRLAVGFITTLTIQQRASGENRTRSPRFTDSYATITLPKPYRHIRNRTGTLTLSELRATVTPYASEWDRKDSIQKYSHSIHCIKYINFYHHEIFLWLRYFQELIFYYC